MDYRNVMAGGVPHEFSWWVFATGLGVRVVSFGNAAQKLGRAKG
jgi:hypothetical protein